MHVSAHIARGGVGLSSPRKITCGSLVHSSHLAWTMLTLPGAKTGNLSPAAGIIEIGANAGGAV